MDESKKRKWRSDYMIGSLVRVSYLRIVFVAVFVAFVPSLYLIVSNERKMNERRYQELVESCERVNRLREAVNDHLIQEYGDQAKLVPLTDCKHEFS